MSYLAFSKNLAEFLTERAGVNQEKEEILAYIIELLVINLGNILLTLIVAILLGVFPGTLVCLIAAVLFRHTAGGAHSNSPWRCAVITITIYPTMALLAVFLTRLGETFVDALSAVALLTGLITITLLAPVDSPAAPIISSYRRKKLKILSIAVYTIISAAVILLRWSEWAYAVQVQACLILAILWVSLMLSKPGHRLMCLIDNIKLKEVQKT